VLAYPILVLVVALRLSTLQSSCPHDFATRLASVRTWSALHEIYKQCPDDGEYGEGMSNTVVTMLAVRWSDLPSLWRLASRDSRFKRLVLRHIDATTDAKDLRRALSNAQTRCPTKHTTFCAEIATALKAAIADL
jgi:hypothetical protein